MTALLLNYPYFYLPFDPILLPDLLDFIFFTKGSQNPVVQTIYEASQIAFVIWVVGLSAVTLYGWLEDMSGEEHRRRQADADMARRREELEARKRAGGNSPDELN